MAQRKDRKTSAAKSLELRAGAMAGEIIRDIDLALIDNNPHQPRTSMDKVALKELTESVKIEGVTQPIVVRKILTDEGDTRYQSAFGHRRRAASEAANLKTIPAIVRDYDDNTMLVIALTENVQREAMSTTDEAAAAAKLVELIGQKSAAERLGKSKQWLSKATGIYKAPDYVQEFIAHEFTNDMEGLYQLAKLAKTKPDAVKALIAEWVSEPELRADLRGQIAAINAPVKSLKSHTEPDEKTKAAQQSGIEYEADETPKQEFGTDGFELQPEPGSGNGDSAGEKTPNSERKAKPGKVKDKHFLLSDAEYVNGVLTMITMDGPVKFDVTENALELLYAAIKA